jgi:outer membrane protease
VKKSFLFLFVFIALGYSVSAQLIDMNGHAFSLGPSVGLFSGEGEKIVYKATGSNDKSKQLLWKMNPLFYIGLDANYKWKKPEKKWGIFGDVLFKYGIPSEDGVIEDREWNPDQPAFLTRYSVHDNETKTAIFFDVNVGLLFNIFGKYTLKTYISWDFMHFSWSAIGGSLLDNGSEILPSVEVITYEQTWHTLSPGIAFYADFNQYFDIEISLALSPFIWHSGKDTHIPRVSALQDLIITEDLSGGLFVKPGLLFSFKPIEFLTLSFSFTYKNISGTRGDSKIIKSGSGEAIRDIGGAGYSAFDIGIVVKFNIVK